LFSTNSALFSAISWRISFVFYLKDNSIKCNRMRTIV